MNGCLNLTGTESKVRVLAVTTAAGLPETARNGTIAMISPMAAEKVYVMRTVPENPNQGDVWMRQGSGLITYQTGTVFVTVNETKQYDGAAWIKRDTYQYLNGWQREVVYLLEAADTCSDVTGGWGDYKQNNGTCTKTDEGYRFTEDNAGNQRGYIQTLNKIELTAYSKICFQGEVTKYTQPVVGGLQTQKASDYWGDNPSGYETPWYNNVKAASYAGGVGPFTIELDISNISGSYYVGLSSGSYALVSKIWMEV